MKHAASNFKKLMGDIAKRHKFNLSDEAIKAGNLASITVRTESKSFMPLHIGIYGENQVIVSHTYEQHGDLMYDPEISFYVAADGNWYPFRWRMSGLHIDRMYGYMLGGECKFYRNLVPLQADTASFCYKWAANIRWQGFASKSSYVVGEDK